MKIRGTVLNLMFHYTQNKLQHNFDKPLTELVR